MAVTEDIINDHLQLARRRRKRGESQEQVLKVLNCKSCSLWVPFVTETLKSAESLVAITDKRRQTFLQIHLKLPFSNFQVDDTLELTIYYPIHPLITSIRVGEWWWPYFQIGVRCSIGQICSWTVAWRWQWKFNLSANVHISSVHESGPFSVISFIGVTYWRGWRQG